MREELRRNEDPDADQVRDMLIYLGRYNRNPVHVVAGHTAPVRNLAAHEPFPGHYYTCKNYDRTTRLCKTYDTRPKMCRSFPNEGPCPFAGCAVVYPWRFRERWYGDDVVYLAGVSYPQANDFIEALLSVVVDRSPIRFLAEVARATASLPLAD